MGSVDLLVAQMIDFSGPLPQEWQLQWEKMKLDYEKSYNHFDASMETKLDERFRTKVQEPSLSILLPIIKGLTKFLPSDHISASEALRLLQTNPYEPEEDSELDDEEDW
jgi:serine/threonine-protein kinase SRPK3